MQIAKWGDALAVRLPAELVESLGLKEGDEVTVSITPWNRPTAEEKEAALAVIESLSRPLPADHKFDREEASSRMTVERNIPSNSKMTREQAIELIQNSRWQLPDGYKFDRDEANERR